VSLCEIALHLLPTFPLLALLAEQKFVPDPPSERVEQKAFQLVTPALQAWC
jgi:hypothetical protein